MQQPQVQCYHFLQNPPPSESLDNLLTTSKYILCHHHSSSKLIVGHGKVQLTKLGEVNKSVFLLVASTLGPYKPELYEVKIQQGEVEGGGGAIHEPPVQVLDPVAKIFDKVNFVVTINSYLATATLRGNFKLYMLLEDSPFASSWNSRTTTTTNPLPSQPLTGIVFDTNTNSLGSFQPPRAYKPGGIVICAYDKLYYLTKPCHPFIPPSFEWYDSTNDRWEHLPAPPSYSEDRMEIAGYAVYCGYILVSLASLKQYEIMVFHITKHEWRRVQIDNYKWARGYDPLWGRAVVVGNVMYALSNLFGRLYDSFDCVTSSVSSPFLFPGMDRVSTLASSLYEKQTKYMVHLGNMEFCLVQTAYNYRRDSQGRQPMWFTTF